VDDAFYEVLGIRIPMIRKPVAPGRNEAIDVEVAARKPLLRSRGHHAARRLVERLDERLQAARHGDIDPDHGEDF
jgi:HPr kinase/phosphorylase